MDNQLRITSQELLDFGAAVYVSAGMPEADALCSAETQSSGHRRTRSTRLPVVSAYIRWLPETDYAPAGATAIRYS
jgi:hypothetical protein